MGNEQRDIRRSPKTDEKDRETESGDSQRDREERERGGRREIEGRRKIKGRWKEKEGGGGKRSRREETNVGEKKPSTRIGKLEEEAEELKELQWNKMQIAGNDETGS